MKIWVDDIRKPPSGDWFWYKTSAGVLSLFKFMRGAQQPATDITLMSLDHDLGGDDTTRAIVLFMCEYEYWPVEVVVHSANPVGIDWLEGMIERYKI